MDSKQQVIDDLYAAMETIAEIHQDADPVTYSRDQFGVVWFTGGQNGCMSRECFENLKIGSFSELPLVDAYNQSIVKIE